MTSDKDSVGARQRMKALLSHTSRTLQQTTALLERQRATVRWLELKGYPAQLGREVYAEMSKVVETLQWQKAWIELDLRRTEHLTLQAQPHPWADHPPPDLLSRISVELERIIKDDGAAKDPEATDRAVNAAILLAAAGS